MKSKINFIFGARKIIFLPSDLQKSRHLQKSRVTERHNRGTEPSSSKNAVFRLLAFFMLGNVVLLLVFFGVLVFQKSVKTAVPDDGNPPGALVSTKLVEWYRFEVGRKHFLFLL